MLVEHTNEGSHLQHPLLMTELVISKDNKFAYNTALDTIPKLMTKLFDRLITCIQVLTPF